MCKKEIFFMSIDDTLLMGGDGSNVVEAAKLLQVLTTSAWASLSCRFRQDLVEWCQYSLFLRLIQP